MYSNYISYIKIITNENFNSHSFKNNFNYNYVLEHISHEQGVEYIELIITEFPNIKDYHVIQLYIL